ncbi:MAG: hypothetical protein L6247_06800 [Desulfobacteraceae bacterium]|nr:hypothetical protein [Pseudomonadota bacterium]MBU4464171.1 hypothetical protein [Pseudomonadota bacterium]MCG2755254.1 hypothetical protein [Desulfobacteraceae bacterium]
MAKIFRPSSREATILSKIESSREFERKKAINSIRDCIEPLSNAIATKLIENNLVETTNKNSLEEQIMRCLDKLTKSEDFDVDFQIAPFRHIIRDPNIVSIYTTAFVIEQLLKHKDVVDIFGSDEDIYICINRQVEKFLSQ